MSLIAGELSAFFEAAGTSGAIVEAGTFSSEFAAFFGDPEKEAKKEAARERKRRQRERVANGEIFQPKSEAEKIRERRERRALAKRSKDVDRVRRIAVLDMETDPFDAAARERIYPFAACLYSDQFKPVMIWEENENEFINKILEAINALPEPYTIYAHNGGKFDFLFLIHRLRGPVSFKGRGIMAAKIGEHELRDSFHIIPEKLASYKKDEIDYDKMRKSRRNNHRKEIEDYLLSDCVYLFEIVKAFLTNYGMKISIGQAAMFLLKKEYPECENVSEMTDTFMRGFFYGGRVECLAGCGDFHGEYKLYDVNSMYPDVMANMCHPIGSMYKPRKGEPDETTFFVDLNCYSAGAFPVKREGEGTIFPHEYGRYRISIHEYNMALKYGLISRIKINYCVDNEKSTTFDRFILPLYNNRILSKEKLSLLKDRGLEQSEEFTETKKDDLFFKLLQNNAYGKFAQNPRHFKEYYLTGPTERPDDETDTWGDFPSDQCDGYAIWARPIKKRRYNNVGTAASITGGARAKLLEARHLANGAIYCDTDSLICKSLEGVAMHKSSLGAWDLEAEISRCLIAGKKLYAYEKTGGKRVIRSKGVRGTTWEQMETLVDGGEIIMSAFAPTLTKTGRQAYIDRRIKATTSRKD